MDLITMDIKQCAQQIGKQICNVVGINTLLVLIVLLVFILFIKVLKINKMNVNKIWVEHIKTLKVSNSQKISISEITIFFIFPLILAIVLTMKSTISSSGINTILTVFSIFAGLLFNLLILTLDVVRRTKDRRNIEQDANKQNLIEQLVKETYSNVSFCILVSIILVCLSFVYVIGITNLYINISISALIYWLVVIFVLTLLMVLKRIFNLLSEEFK